MRPDFLRGVLVVRPAEDGGVKFVFGGHDGLQPVMAAIGAAIAAALFSQGRGAPDSYEGKRRKRSGRPSRRFRRNRLARGRSR